MKCRIVVALAISIAACGDNLEVVVPHAPQVESGGGPILAAPEVVPIFFAGDDDMQHQLETFLVTLAASDYWHATTSEYGVGRPTILPSIVTSDPPPTTDDALQAWLEGHLAPPLHSPSVAAPVPVAWPAPDPNTVYVVFLPQGVTLTIGTTDTSCKTFGGYHDETAQQAIVYALLPRCPPSGAPIDEITPALSHELIEASTDPHPNTAPAWVEIDYPDIVWAFTPGAELGDMCEYIQAARQRLVGEFLVQRTWSNSSAAAGHDPCVPTLASPYVAAAPVLVDLDLVLPDQTIATTGVEVPNGTATTIDVALFSDAPTDPWTIGVDDVASVLQGTPAELAVSFDDTTGNHGELRRLTIRRLMDGANGGSELVVTSKVNGVTVSLWWALVTN